jgi:hypothetical protein
MTTWTIAVDWDRNGNYTDMYDDVTSRIISASWFLGMKRPRQDYADDSTLDLVLDNSDKRYSPENASSPLYGTVAPFRPVRIESNDGALRTHWIGWIERIEPEVDLWGKRQVKITAAGPMQFFKAAETAIALQENQRTDSIVEQLISEVVIPPALSSAWVLEMPGYSEIEISTRLPDVTAFSDLDEGVVTLAIAADNWVSRNSDARQSTFNVYKAIADVAAAERGRFLFSRDGKALFWNRILLQDDITSSVTLNDTMTDLKYTYAASEDLKNEIIVTCHPRVVGSSDTEVLWQLDKEVTIPAGETRTIGVRYQDSDTGNIRIGGKDVTLSNITFKSGTASVTLEARANSAQLKVSNNDTVPAILSTATVQGRKITDYGQMEAQSRDGLSIANYGRRSMKINLPSVDNFEYAQYIANYEVSRRGQPRGMVTQVTLASHGKNGGGNHAHQLARTLGDVITISETQTAHNNKRYVIIGEAHKLTEGATKYETTWYLEPATDAPFPWKLDGGAPRSELDATTYLGY